MDVAKWAALLFNLAAALTIFAVRGLAQEIPVSATGIVLLKDSPTQPDEFVKSVVYYTDCEMVRSGAPLYLIHQPSGKELKLETWAVAGKYPFDDCFNSQIITDDDAARIKAKQAMFAESEKKFAASAKVLAGFTRLLTADLKRYSDGEVRRAGQWMSRAVLDAEKQREQRITMFMRKNTENMAAAGGDEQLVQAFQEPLSEGKQKSVDTVKKLLQTVMPTDAVRSVSLQTMLEHLKFKVRELAFPAGITFEVWAVDPALKKQLETRTVSFEWSQLSLFEVLKAVAGQSQARILVHRERVLFTPLEESGVFPKSESVDDWKEEAGRRYPALAWQDSENELRAKVAQAVKAKRASDAGYFSSNDWPLRIATTEASKLGIKPVSTRPGPDLVQYFPATAKVARAADNAPPAQRESALPEPGARGHTGLTHVQIARVASPSVGIIYTLDAKGDSIAQGSGFVVARNVLVTNHHVIDDASIAGAVVKFPGLKTFYNVDGLIADDPSSDLAALHIKDLPVQPLVIHRGSLPEIGTDIFVLGSPKGLSFTFSSGMISGLRSSPDDKNKAWLQMTAPISHGSSGGPVLDENAEVIGVSVAGRTDGQNLNFAIPSQYILKLLERR